MQLVCRKYAAAFLHKERTQNLTILRSEFGAVKQSKSEQFLFDATSAASSNVMACVSLMITPIMQFQDGQSLCPPVPL